MISTNRRWYPRGIRHVIDYDGADGPEGHPDLNAFHRAALGAGGTDNGPPGARLHYDPRYYAANILDPDGYSIEVVYRSWQHPQP